MKAVKPTVFRENMKRYMDTAYEGETLVIPRNGGRNVVVISEEAYNKLGDGLAAGDMPGFR